MNAGLEPMQVCLIPDEYSHDPATAFELGRRWGVEHYEIRYAYRWRVPICPDWAAERVAAAVRDYGVTVTGISPGLFKPTMRTDGTRRPISTRSRAEIRRHLEDLLPRFFAFAEQLGTRNVTVFALPKAADAKRDKPPQIVIDSLTEAAEKARQGGFTLLLENGGGSWADTAGATAAVLDAVGSDALRLTWDPANAAWADPDSDPVARGYPLIRRHLANVHVKDLTVTEGKPAWAMLGEGIIDWPEQLRRLRADGYAGPLTLEPHLQYQQGMQLNLVQRVEQFLARLRQVTGM